MRHCLGLTEETGLQSWANWDWIIGVYVLLLMVGAFGIGFWLGEGAMWVRRNL